MAAQKKNDLFEIDMDILAGKFKQSSKEKDEFK